MAEAEPPPHHAVPGAQRRETASLDTASLDVAGADTAQIILDLARARGTGKSICPSEAARVIAGQVSAESWQKFLTPVRQAAVALAREGKIEILRKGKPVTPDGVRGVIRLRIAPDVQDETAAQEYKAG